jgi:hypothetical protein
MNLLTPAIRMALKVNARASEAARAAGRPAPDHHPVARFFNPVGNATWLATEIDEYAILFGLADLGFGSPELGSFSLREMASVRLQYGLGIERDISFEAFGPLSAYASAARLAGSLLAAEAVLRARLKRGSP